MRFATYNVEWFHRLFSDDGQLLEDGEWSARYNVTREQQAKALGRVFRRIDADGIMIIEAPDSHSKRDGEAALETFARRFKLRARKAVIGYVNDTQQEIAFLYDPDKLSAVHEPMESVDVPRFDGAFVTDVDDAPEPVNWSKPPLELAVSGKGWRLRMIGVHAKSKAPHGAANDEEMMAMSIANRRKQLAQCLWLRARVEEHLDAGDSTIVLGDFNDGPGLDQYERLFGRSGVEVVLGEGEQQMLEPNAMRALNQRVGGSPTTARFYLRNEKRYLQALLDYVMLSPDLKRRNPRWRIWHPFDDPECWDDERLRNALLTGSDHFPVTVDLDLGKEG